MDKKKLLIVQFAIGPTHKSRLLYNLKTYSGYDLYDVFIITDSVEFFDSVKHKSNLFINDIDEIRKDYPWSIEFEKIPKEKFDESKYAKEVIEGNIKIPTLMRRFVFCWDKVYDYDGFIFMDCDVIPLYNEYFHNRMENFFTNPLSEHPDFSIGVDLTDKIIMIPGAGSYDRYHHEYLMDFAKDINERYKITDRELEWRFPITDGNFRTIKFPNKSLIKPFFELMNNIIYDVLVDKKYFYLGTHSMWNNHSEYILSIMLNLYDGYTFPFSHGLGLLSNTTFRIDCYPEDRFWNWGMNMESSLIGKMDFVKKNYDKLKEFYKNRGQEFPY
jgi:hypothetical protein